MTLNLRAGAYLGRWSVEVYGKNLTNERGVTVISEPGPLPNGALGLGLVRPRTDRRVGRDEVLGLVAAIVRIGPRDASEAATLAAATVPGRRGAGRSAGGLRRPRRADPDGGRRSGPGRDDRGAGQGDPGARLRDVRRLGEDAPVDADTIFQLGSVGKAFTTAALAVLVDRGQIAWDDPVTKHIPWFQMYDPWVTREMTVRRSAGASQRAGPRRRRPDVRAALDACSRAETVRRLRYIRPATSFRSALRLRQRALRRRRPADRGGERQDLGAVRARGGPGPRRHAHGDVGPRLSPRARPTAPGPMRAATARCTAWARRRRSTTAGRPSSIPSWAPMPRPPGASRPAPTTWAAGSRSSSRAARSPRAGGACSARRRRARCGRRACTCRSRPRRAPPRRRRPSSTPTRSAGSSGTIAATGS